MELNNILNIKNSTRNMSDKEFDDVVGELSEQLSHHSYIKMYDKEELLCDWKRLVEWNEYDNVINSKQRLGLKLCEHFFPGIYDVCDKNGKSFSKLWKDPKHLEKVLRWNRKVHSTPYISELRRGVYFCGGITKTTMYRPQIAKMISRNSNIVLDPCAGWGGRLLGVTSGGNKYIGFEPNTKTFEGLEALVEMLELEDLVTIINDDARNMNNYNIPTVDMILTSPPYYNMEIYSNEPTQSTYNVSSYDDWLNKFIVPIISKSLEHLRADGSSCWNVARIGKNDFAQHIDDIHNNFGFVEVDSYSVVSSKIPGYPTRKDIAQHNNITKNADYTKIFKMRK